MALTTDLSHDTKDTLKRDLRLTNEQYNTIYYDVEIKMSTRGLLGQPLRSLTSKAQIRQISNEISNEFPSVFLGLPENLRTKYVKQLAQRCSHNATRRTNKTVLTRQITTGNPVLPHFSVAHYPPAGIPKAIRQEGTPRSYGTTTILIRRAADEEPIIIPTRKLATGKNDALDIRVDDLSFDTFVDMLGQDINFDPKSETLCYYVGDKIAGGRIQLVNEEKWRSAVEDMFLQEMDRFSFTIEQRRTSRLLPKTNLALLTRIYSLRCQPRTMQSLTLYFRTLAFTRQLALYTFKNR
jgi:hypothetical protein